jgi:hypothetical protein
MPKQRFERHDEREPLMVCKVCGLVVEYRKKLIHTTRCEETTQLLALFNKAGAMADQDALPPY